MKFLNIKLLIIMVIGSIVTIAQSPDITELEYYYDTDPGFGNGTSVPVSPDSITNTSFSLDISSLDDGTHYAFIRAKNTDDVWSFVQKLIIQKVTPPPLTPDEDIVDMEYFFDSDPGFGNGIHIAVTNGNVSSTAFDIDISGLSPGYHKVSIRSKDENGIWSLNHVQNVVKIIEDPLLLATDIVAMEYFFDTDPGLGSGASIPVTADTITSTAFDIDISGLSPGFHKVYFRSKDENDRWTLNYVQNLVKIIEDPIAPSTDIVAMEYFFDTDPGFGNGTTVPMISDTVTNTVFDIDISGLDAGYHKVYVRTKNENEIWNLGYIHNIVKVIEEPFIDSPEMVTLEYYFDADPGFGNGTAVSFSLDSIVDLSFNVDILAEFPGDQNLYIRLKDENNIWSHSSVDTIFVKGLRVLLEGPYDPGTELMSSALNDESVIPLEQPFDSDPTAEWYYDGSEVVAEIPNENIVDWLLLQVRDATSAENATSTTINENQVAFLLKNGKIVGLDGESNISFTEPLDNDLYLVVYHRNHLGVMSSEPLDTEGEYEFTYLFSNGPNQVYGGVNAHKNLGSGLWGLVGGDGDANGQITNDDKTVVWQNASGNAGFLPGDYNMDGQVGNSDKNDIWIENNNTSSQIPN